MYVCLHTYRHTYIDTDIHKDVYTHTYMPPCAHPFLAFPALSAWFYWCVGTLHGFGLPLEEQSELASGNGGKPKNWHTRSPKHGDSQYKLHTQSQKRWQNTITMARQEPKTLGKTTNKNHASRSRKRWKTKNTKIPCLESIWIRATQKG